LIFVLPKLLLTSTLNAQISKCYFASFLPYWHSPSPFRQTNRITIELCYINCYTTESWFHCVTFSNTMESWFYYVTKIVTQSNRDSIVLHDLWKNRIMIPLYNNLCSEIIFLLCIFSKKIIYIITEVWFHCMRCNIIILLLYFLNWPLHTQQNRGFIVHFFHTLSYTMETHFRWNSRDVKKEYNWITIPLYITQQNHDSVVQYFSHPH